MEWNYVHQLLHVYSHRNDVASLSNALVVIATYAILLDHCWSTHTCSAIATCTTIPQSKGQAGRELQ